MRVQWADVAHRDFGIQLDARFANSHGVAAKDYDGIAVTYQGVAAQPLLYRRMVGQAPTLVILDEIHHGGDELTWARALETAFEEAARRLLLSGTPDRSDRREVPFVQYLDGKFKADVTYDYGMALADREGVVRQIAFPTFDGDARWVEASRVEEKIKLSEVDENTRAKALSSVLLPDGPWIASVLREANKELTRQREYVPDAGGLVVASDQAKAVKYAKTLERICGEPVHLAISDLPDASQRIAEYANGTGRWIVAVAMVSEGVDIPRLVVGVYATRISTDLFFRQVAGRFVRTRSHDDEACATLFIPSVQPLVSYAAEIERLIPRALRDAEDRARRESKTGGQVEIDLVTPLAASEAVRSGTILSGDNFTDAELHRAEQAGLLAGVPASLSAVQIARLARVLGAGRTLATTVMDLPKPSLGQEKDVARKDLKRRVGYLARLVDRPHSHINNDLNKLCGDTVPTASLETLRRRRQLVEEWIQEAAP